MKKHSIKAVFAATALAFAVGAQAQYASGDIVVQVYDPVSTETLDAVLLNAGTAQGQITAAVSGALDDTIAGFSTFASSAGVGPASGFEYTILGGSTVTGDGDLGTSGTTSTGPTKANLVSVFGSGVQTSITNLLSTSNYAITAAGAATTAGGFNTANTDFGVSTLGDVVSSSTNSGFGLYAFTGTLKTTGNLGTNVAPVSFDNAGDVTIGTTTAVPEPGTYALMAAGLLAVGAIVRRRARS